MDVNAVETNTNYCECLEQAEIKEIKLDVDGKEIILTHQQALKVKRALEGLFGKQAEFVPYYPSWPYFSPRYPVWYTVGADYNTYTGLNGSCTVSV